MKELYFELQGIFKPYGKCYFAGGCVRDFLLDVKPKDYDFFILTQANFKEIKKEIQNLDFVKNNTVQVKVDWHKSEPYLIATLNYKGYDIQIMCNTALSIDDLLRTFDWNVCLFSYGEEGFYNLENIENIGVGKELKLNKLTYPYSTLRRGYRFSERFIMKFKTQEIFTIINYIVKSNGFQKWSEFSYKDE